MQRTYRSFEIFCKTNSSVGIWLNGEPAAVQKRAENIWNGAKYRVATDGAFNEIQNRRTRVEWPDVVCGDFDSLDTRIEAKNAQMVHRPDQDKNDLTKAIEYCLEQMQTEKWSFDRIVLLGGLNGRFDHTMSTLSALAAFSNNATPIFVLDSRNLVHAVPAGKSEIHLDSELITGMCGVIPLVQAETIVTSKGLKYEMKELPLAFGILISSSNEVTSDVVCLESTAPLLFTIELKSLICQ